MKFSIDLRYLFPPLLNLIIFFMFLKSQDGNSWAVQDGTSEILLYPILKLPFFSQILVLLLLLIYLFISVKLHLRIRRQLSVRCGKLSVLLAISTLASLILAPSLFLVAYLCLIILSLCYSVLASPCKRCFDWFLRLTSTVITSIPTNFITCTVNPAPPQVEVNINRL